MTETTRVGALTLEERDQLEAEIFDNHGASEMLNSIRQAARDNFLPPVAMLVGCIQQVLSSLPAGCGFDSGKRGTPNLFTVMVGAPGCGKDELAKYVEGNITVSVSDKNIDLLRPELAQPSSGEALVDNLVSVDDVPPSPCLVSLSEGSELVTLMGREGSRLRTTLLNVYSGNAVGSDTRTNGKKRVMAYSYTCGLKLNIQPSIAYLLLQGNDDGFRDRFLWCEVIDPRGADGSDLLDIEKRARVKPIDIPKKIYDGKLVQFPKEIKREILQSQHALRTKWVATNGSGHSVQTRCKVATGLALIHGRSRVSGADWARAGALVEYSKHVQNHNAKQRTRQEAAVLAERELMKDQAEVLTQSKRADRIERVILESMIASKDGSITWSAAKQAVGNAKRYGEIFPLVVDRLEVSGVIRKKKGDKGGTRLTVGENFRDAVEDSGLD